MSSEARIAVVLGIGLLACTKPNPEFCKEMPNDPMCGPAMPDAAADAAPDAVPDALTCTTGAFEMCQDPNTSLVCNAAGNAFVPTACPNGCNTTFGCQICAPNQTTCANDNTQTCDSLGNVSSDELCTLGCSADATRCKTLVPSNNLGMFYSMTPDPQDIFLFGTLDVATGNLMDANGNVTSTLASFAVEAPMGGAPIQVFVGKHVTIADLTIIDTSVSSSVGRAIAILATGDIEVTGRVAVLSGAVDLAGCTGSDANLSSTTTPKAQGGAGGGGHASAGATGGRVVGLLIGTSGGAISGSAELVPLRGGCPGGKTGLVVGNFGGGAMQLVSLTTVVVTGSIVVDATSSQGRGGGGSGGGLLIEAPTVSLNPSAKLLARGGGGSSGGSPVTPPGPPDDASAPSGAICNPTVTTCGSGGAGAAPTSAATGGGPTGTFTSGGNTQYAAGGGGGGIGRIRINTKDGTFTTSSSVILAADVTNGIVGSN